MFVEPTTCKEFQQKIIFGLSYVDEQVELFPTKSNLHYLLFLFCCITFLFLKHIVRNKKMAMFLTIIKALKFNSQHTKQKSTNIAQSTKTLLYIFLSNILLSFIFNRTVGLEFLNNAILDFLLVQHGIIEFQNHPIQNVYDIELVHNKNGKLLPFPICNFLFTELAHAYNA